MESMLWSRSNFCYVVELSENCVEWSKLWFFLNSWIIPKNQNLENQNYQLNQKKLSIPYYRHPFFKIILSLLFYCRYHIIVIFCYNHIIVIFFLLSYYCYSIFHYSYFNFYKKMFVIFSINTFAYCFYSEIDVIITIIGFITDLFHFLD